LSDLIFTYNNKKYLLRGDVIYSYKRENGVHHIECSELNIYVIGKTVNDVNESFYFNIHALYVNYVLELDANLTTGGIKLKNKFKNMIFRLWCE